jgi:F0F1-type ATP synthase membrane subunit a
MFYSPLEQFDVIFLFHFFLDYDNIFFIDISFFNILIPFIILMVLFISLKKLFSFFTLIPTTIFQSFFENNLKFILNLIKQQIGKIAYKYIIFIYCIFFFILGLNLLSMLPFGIALTSHLIVILFLSLSICIGILIEGIKY